MVLTSARQAIEFYVRKPVFIVMTVLVPLVVLGLAHMEGLVHIVAPLVLSDDGQYAGIVDETGLFTPLPATYEDDLLVFPAEGSAIQAMENGGIVTYAFIPYDFFDGGYIYGPVMEEEDVITDEDRLLTLYLMTVMLSSDEPAIRELTDLAFEPMGVMRELGRPVTRVVAVVLILSMFGAASHLLSPQDSIEAPPRSLFFGRVVGVGALHLVRVLVWLAFFLLLTRARPSVWMLVYFVLGYALYALIFATIAKSSVVVKWAVMLVITVVFVASLLPFLFEAAGVDMRLLSWFPLTAPGAMITRLARSNVPPLDMLVSISLLVSSIPLAMMGGLLRREEA